MDVSKMETLSGYVLEDKDIPGLCSLTSSNYSREIINFLNKSQATDNMFRVKHPNTRLPTKLFGVIIMNCAKRLLSLKFCTRRRF
ncbi:hypothetical protein SLE2022_400850 [Rubroshorea leprosula]